MKKTKYLIVIFIIVLTITGCKNKEQKNISGASKNTSISENNIKSYRAKVSITSKNVNESYVVLNENNKNYTISYIEDNKNITIKIDEKGEKVTTDSGEIYTGTIKYDYKNTDIFLEGLNTDDKDLKTKEIEIGKEKYTQYDFKIKKETFNKIMKSFKITVKKDGTGYAYVDKDQHVFLINYSIDDVNVNVTYTRLVTK